MLDNKFMTRFRFMGLVIFFISFLLFMLFVNLQVQARYEDAQVPQDDPIPVVYLPFVSKNSGGNEGLWTSSAHNDTLSAAFTNWDDEEPPEIPVECARCHSTPGYLDYLGADGTPAWVVDNPAPIGTTIECEACHDDAAVAMTSVEFHSGAFLTGLGRDASCMQCHQGRGSTPGVNAHISGTVGTALDTPNSGLVFQDIHNQFGGDLLYGTWVQGGYEYDGQDYDAHFDHADGANTCIDCHEPHSLEIRLDTCQPCHTGVTTPADFKDIRRTGSLVDYDGDGNTAETIEAEINGLGEMLYLALRRYAGEFTTQDIAYTPDTAPYFFQDDGDGIVGPGENLAYADWTGRLVMAAYNYHLSVKAPGAYVHGAKYLIELLYDSIDDLNTVITDKVSLSTANREDEAHFDASDPAWRNWDSAGLVPADCARCHTTSGYAKQAQGLTVGDEPVSGGLNCEGCHDDLITLSRFSVSSVEFPNGAHLSMESISVGSSDDNLCLGCHQSRLSTADIDSEIDLLPLDDVDGSLNFLDPHNLAAGSTLFGDDAEGMYQYEGKSYLGARDHDDASNDFRTCLDCHDEHTSEVASFSNCSSGPCHQNSNSILEIRESGDDFDGDSSSSEGIVDEVKTLHQALYAAIQSYATDTVGTADIVYSPEGTDFFYIDTNGNGDPDPDEVTPGNAYSTWTPRLLRVAYNYHYLTREPGAYVHHALYVIQVLYDSIEDIGGAGSVLGMTRPNAGP